MRLITKKLYRAFPELDHYPEEQCERFVAAARRNGRFRVLAILSMLVVGFGTLAIGAYALSEAQASIGTQRVARSEGEVPGFLVDALCVVVCIGPTPLAVYLARDVLMRLRLRRLLRSRGACPGCGYRLLGLQVSAESKVVCPECGTPTAVDPAMGELAIDDRGATIFRPEVVVARVTPVFSPRAWRRIGLTAMWLVIVFVGVPVCVVGGWELWIRAQASRARGMYVTAAQVEAAMPGKGGVAGANAWDAFSRLAEKVVSVQKDAGTRTFTRPSGRADVVYPSVAWLKPGKPVTDPDEIGYVAANSQAGEALFAKYREAGVFLDLQACAALPTAVWTCPAFDPAAGISQLPMRDTHAYRELLYSCVVRMLRARAAHDGDEYVAAFEGGLAMARILRSRALPIDQFLWSMAAKWMFDDACRTVNSVDASWIGVEMIDAMDRAVQRQYSPLDVRKQLEVTRIVSVDELTHIFDQPDNVRLGGYSRRIGSLMNVYGAPAYVPRFWIGTLEQNVAEVNAKFEEAVMVGTLEPWERVAKAPMANASLPLAQTATHTLLGGPFSLLRPSGMSIFDRAELGRRFWVVTAALHRYRLTHGALPSSLGELDAASPKDPWTGKDLLYKPRGETYVLYSVGPDRVDDGGIGHPNTEFRAGTDEIAGEE